MILLIFQYTYVSFSTVQNIEHSNTLFFIEKIFSIAQFVLRKNTAITNWNVRASILIVPHGIILREHQFSIAIWYGRSINFLLVFEIEGTSIFYWYSILREHQFSIGIWYWENINFLLVFDMGGTSIFYWYLRARTSRHGTLRKLC